MLDDQPAEFPAELGDRCFTSLFLKITVDRTQSGVVIVTAVGEIDMATVQELRVRLPDGAIAAPGIVMDLSQVSFLSSAGLAALARVRAQCEEGGTPFALVIPDDNRAVRMPLQVAGMDMLFRVVATVDEAVGD